MRAVALALLFAIPAHAGPDGGWDVELYDAGAVLAAPMACETPGDAVNLDVALRTSQRDADSYRGWVLVVTPVAVVAIIAAGVLAAAYATKK